MLHKGRIVEEGTHEELLERNGYYYRLYQLQYQEQERAESHAAESPDAEEAVEQRSA